MKRVDVAELKRRGTYRPDRHASRAGGLPVAGGPIPQAPAHLSAASRRTWRRIVAEWVLDPASLLVLTVALEARDRIEEARAVIARDGATVTTTRGAIRAHPMLRIEAAARTAMLQALRQLHLDAEEVAPR